MLFRKPESKTAHLSRGKSAEEAAHQFLLAEGLLPVDRNFRCKQGELDLIMLDQQALVIVEVRFRASDRYGSAAESVTPSKQSRIIAATHCYLSQSPQHQKRAMRFDVVALSGVGSINWIKNAF
ncbi:YraN family protein [Methylosoma difficile]